MFYACPSKSFDEMFSLYKEKMKTWLKKEVHAKINFRLKEFELIGYVKQSG